MLFRAATHLFAMSCLGTFRMVSGLTCLTLYCCFILLMAVMLLFCFEFKVLIVFADCCRLYFGSVGFLLGFGWLLPLRGLHLNYYWFSGGYVEFGVGLV